MRKRNWKEYNRQLIQRGSLTFLIDPNILNSKPKPSGKKGHPFEFSDPLIIMLMMVKIHFKFPYRALEGFMKSLAKLGTWSFIIPSYSLICKRAAFLKDTLTPLSKCQSGVVLVDASGAKIIGEGEWKVKIHGKSKRRQWVKVHIALDPENQEIIAEQTTASSVKDGKVMESLLNNIKGKVELVIGDGAYDEKCSRRAVRKKHAKALISPPRNGRVYGIDLERDDAIRVIRGLGGDKLAKSLWGRLTGYSIRSLVETAFSRMKRLFGERLFSKKRATQAVENHLRCSILNKMRGPKKIAAALALG